MMMKYLYLLTFCVASIVVVLAGCRSDYAEDKSRQQQSEQSSPTTMTPQSQQPSTDSSIVADPTAVDALPIPDPVDVKKAKAFLNPTAGNTVYGEVTFEQVDDGVNIIANIKDLTAGKHGFHIHEHGDCSASDASSAGGHFNPHNKKHGGPDDEERHAGDFGNLEADEGGNARYERVDKVIKLNGSDSIIGKSLVVHSDADDLTSQPSGNAGSRQACGIIFAE